MAREFSIPHRSRRPSEAALARRAGSLVLGTLLSERQEHRARSPARTCGPLNFLAISEVFSLVSCLWSHVSCLSTVA